MLNDLRFWDQETLSDPTLGTHGDCVRACFRTYMQADMSSLPHPIDPETGGWNVEFFEVLEETYGLVHRVKHVRTGIDYGFMPRIVMAGGTTVRTPENGARHLVVYDRVSGTVIHDPHPSRAGLTIIETLEWLEAVSDG